RGRGGPGPPRFLRGGAGRGWGTVLRRVTRRLCRRVYRAVSLASTFSLPPASLPFGFVLAFFFHSLAGGLVVVPVMEPVSAFHSLPHAAMNKFSGCCRVVAGEPCEHPGRHEPIGQASGGPGPGAGPQGHGAVRRVVHLGVVVKGIVHGEPRNKGTRGPGDGSDVGRVISRGPAGWQKLTRALQLGRVMAGASRAHCHAEHGWHCTRPADLPSTGCQLIPSVAQP